MFVFRPFIYVLGPSVALSEAVCCGIVLVQGTNTKAHKWCQAGAWLSGATSSAPFPVFSKYPGIFSGYRILPISARNVFFECTCASTSLLSCAS